MCVCVCVCVYARAHRTGSPAVSYSVCARAPRTVWQIRPRKQAAGGAGHVGDWVLCPDSAAHGPLDECVCGETRRG